MILIDTSAWIDYLRGADSSARRTVSELLRQQTDELVTCEPIAMELLAGSSPSSLSSLESLMDGLPSLRLNEATDFRDAARLFRAGRSSGRTVRSLNDCVITVVALRNDATVLHKDADFEALSDICGLKQRSCR